MAGIEVGVSNAYCTRCGTQYGKRKGFFPVNYGLLYKGLGYMGVCRPCIDDMYERYLNVCHDPKLAVRQMCRKLDLYWSESAYAAVEKKNTTRSMMTSYITKINNNTYINRCYDDTLEAEGKLWDFGSGALFIPDTTVSDSAAGNETVEVDQSIIDFWGPGLSSDQYMTLDQRRKYHLSRLAEERGVEEDAIDLGTDMLIRQIVNLEVSINAKQSEGKDVNKDVATLVDLLQKVDWKPAKKEDIDSADAATPLGVWIDRWENKRPLPEIDDDLKDVNGIKKYIFTWMGHLTKMLGIRGGYTKLYDEEVARLRVEKPEYEDEDDETLLSDYYSESGYGDAM